MKGNGSMAWGYRLDVFYDLGLKYAIRLPIASHCHALLTGGSGSGKSTAVLYLIGSLLRNLNEPFLELDICDFKHSEDFYFLQGCKNYYAGDAVYDGVMRYYAKFVQARQQGKSPRRHLLVFDEYPSAVSYFQGKDKRDKTKLANDLLGAVSEILMLGRGLSYGIWIVTQRPDNTLFQSGARDNFMVYLALGRLSKEQKGMIFPGEELPSERIYLPGEGLLLADGYPLTEVKFPLIFDMDDWKRHILECLNCPPGA